MESPWTTASSSLLHQLSPSNSFVSSSSVDNAPTLLNDADIDSCWHSFNKQTSTHLIHVLSDLVKAFVDTESDIQKNLEKMGFSSSEHNINKEELHHSLEDAFERLSVGEANNELSDDGPDLITSSSTFYSSLDLSSISKDVSQNINVEDDVVLGASRRLRAAVERILRLLNEIVNINQEHDVQDLIRRNDELVNELNEEVKRREKLTHQLLLAEKSVKLLEESKNKFSLELLDYQTIKKEFDSMKSKLEKYEMEREEWAFEKEQLKKDKSNFFQGLPELQQICTSLEQIKNDAQSSFNESDNFEELLLDTEKLNVNIRTLQQENIILKTKLKLSEDKIENSFNECDQLLKSRSCQYEDLKAQLEAAEKQISSYKKFIQEQALERETEREDFIREITNLKEINSEKNKFEKKLKDTLESCQAQLESLSEEKKNFLKKQNEMELKLSDSNQAVTEMKSILFQTEKENKKLALLEQKLIKQCDDLEKALHCQVQMNEEMNRDNLNNCHNLTNSLIDAISSKTNQIKKLFEDDLSQAKVNSFLETKTIQSEHDTSNLEEKTFACSFIDLQMLGERLNLLNGCVDFLISKNSKLSLELKNSTSENQNFQKKLCELQKDKEKLQLELSQTLRTVDLLQDELNAKHLQLSALKTRLDGTSCLDIHQYKATINDYKKKLLVEESRVEMLEQQIDSFQSTLEEANLRIKQLVEELQIIENLKDSLEIEKNDLINEKETLFNEKLKLFHELEELKMKPKQKSIEDENMVPQILQMVVHDKNEEIQDLTHQLKTIQNKLESLFPNIEKNAHLLLDEFIKSFNDYKEIAKNYKPTNLGVDSGISQSQSLPSSPKAIILKEKYTNTDNSLTTHYLKDCKFQKLDCERKILKKRLEEIELKYDLLCSTLNRCKEENDLLKHKLESFREDNSCKNETNKDNQASTAYDSDIELIDTSLETALQKLHNQSLELLKLSENKRNQKDSLLWLIIDALSSLSSNEVDHQPLIGCNLKKKLLENFPNEELCSLIVQKLLGIQELFKDYQKRLQFYFQQNELITSQMASVEELSSKVQVNSIMFQKKYQEMKKKLKNHLNKNSSNFIISDRSELFFKYRLCLSHKNSLIYQKKYLLNVLGGFRLTEKAILALLANSNVTTENSLSSARTKISHFKYAVWAIIAVSRIRFLQKKHSSKNIVNQYSSKLPNFSTSPFNISPNKSKKGCFAKYETDMTLQEFSNCLKQIHHTIGQNELDIHSSDNAFSDCLDSNINKN